MAEPERREEPRTLTAEQFAASFHASARILWTIAAGVLTDPHMAEDVLQEAALIGLEKRAQFRVETADGSGPGFTAWMGRIVRFVALNQLRRRHRRREVEADTGQLAVAAGDSATLSTATAGFAGGALLDEEALDQDLRQALARLPATARACLLLKVVLGLEYGEIASSLGIKAATAMSHVHRAKNQLRERLPERAAARGGGRGAR